VGWHIFTPLEATVQAAKVAPFAAGSKAQCPQKRRRRILPD
jgi:hypothetical protein